MLTFDLFAKVTHIEVNQNQNFLDPYMPNFASVLVSIPWLVGNCGISWSYLLNFRRMFFINLTMTSYIVEG